MASAVKEKAGVLVWETPQALFPVAGNQSYDIASDGQRFVVLQPIEDAKPSPLTVVINWQAGLAK